MTRPQSVLLAFLCILSCSDTGAFSPTQLAPVAAASYRCLSVRWNSKLFGPDEDFDEEKQQREGEALAKKFYEQMRKREEQQSTGPTTASTTNETPPISSQETMQLPPKKTKFTGKPSDFAGREGGLYSSSSVPGEGPQTPRQQMMQREFDLVNRAEKGLAYQAIFAVCVLIFYIYVGATGGIQSGGDDVDLGADDTVIDEIILPQQRDTEASYWL